MRMGGRQARRHAFEATAARAPGGDRAATAGAPSCTVAHQPHCASPYPPQHTLASAVRAPAAAPALKIYDATKQVTT